MDLETNINETKMPQYQGASTTMPNYDLLEQGSPIYSMIDSTQPYQVSVDVKPDGSYSITMSYMQPLMDALGPYLGKLGGGSEVGTDYDLGSKLNSYEPKELPKAKPHNSYLS